MAVLGIVHFNNRKKTEHNQNVIITSKNSRALLSTSFKMPCKIMIPIVKLWDASTYQFPNVEDYTVNFGNGWIITSHTLLGMWLLIKHMVMWHCYTTVCIKSCICWGEKMFDTMYNRILDTKWSCIARDRTRHASYVTKVIITVTS